MAQPSEPPPTRTRAHVWGLVQGVGFRPFVWRRATARGLSGWVANDATGVVLEVEGTAESVASLLDDLSRPPPLARIDGVRSEVIPPTGGAGFEIRRSVAQGVRLALVLPDTATCRDCLREMHDSADRRFGHPFINCTACGPRYTIVRAVPYDRAHTTMADLPLCGECRAEYEDPTDRRFHAEAVCCPACGPAVHLHDGSGQAVRGGDAIAAAVTLLSDGAVVAVKGLGGYHLAVDARDEAAVTTLRQRKHREERPFAVMVLDRTAARELCELSSAEEVLLTGVARPIVLLRRRAERDVATAVAPGSPTLGLMLPYTPVHTLLLEAHGGPLVLTSGNRSDEPIAFEDTDAASRLGPIADAFLLHDRPIHTRADDSVVKVVGGRTVPIRRSRGFVPSPITLPQPAAEPVLACGAALKNTFCLVRGTQAFVSHHVGDLDDYATRRSYVEAIAHLRTLLDLDPTVVAHDLHPDYASTGYALELPDVELVGVQHHHAHIASCLVDNGVRGPAIGVAFDGVGFGTDGTAWGGEFLLADLRGFVRAAHLASVAMPGGDAVVRQPWRMAAAHLDAAYGGELPRGLGVAQRQGRRWEQVLCMARAGVSAPPTSSAGRLFDAVSSLLGVRDETTYEGQAAVELEHLADASETGSYAVPVDPGGVVEASHLVRAVCDDLLRDVDVARVAARFHNALADVVLDVCNRLRDQHGVLTVALSGGVFQNGLLLSRCLDRLEEAGFTVLTHRQVPPNDGGISLGQAAVAAARLHQR